MQYQRTLQKDILYRICVQLLWYKMEDTPCSRFGQRRGKQQPSKTGDVGPIRALLCLCADGTEVNVRSIPSGPTPNRAKWRKFHVSLHRSLQRFIANDIYLPPITTTYLTKYSDRDH